MLNLGIIGTNWITKQFIEASDETNSFKLTHIYSRTEEKAKDFAASVNTSDAKISTDLEEFFSSDDFDVVYIASPNSLHYSQSKLAMEHGKHVIVEKPSTANIREFTILEETAKSNNVYFLEAARHIHEPIFKSAEKYVNENRSELTGGTFSYMKYSSKYDDFLAKKIPNVFTTKFSGGALYDLGVYAVYDAVVLLGRPDKINYDAEILEGGIDGSGVLTLSYPDFDANLIVGKTKNSHIPSEVYFGKKTLLLMDNGGDITNVTLVNGNSEDLISNEKSSNPMDAEAVEFARIIEEKDQAAFEKLLGYARTVNKLLEQARITAGIIFESDKEY
ncbi:Gfo/Idh/MocA family protein [Companilactobacillus metriopterae]|uniref:Gfo/Idh/MocA family protein n=1 Tax=Companilactobacillus metriopterae TaxID=1909267 RepID=UPI00100A9CF1|nr:Gfo/Idh/MocA family oxidoreductase [Companilactobacillus metriopterae]